MEDKGREDIKKTELFDEEEQSSETVLLDANAHTKETLSSSSGKDESDSYRDVLRKLSDATAEAAETSGEFGAVFNVRALVGKTLAKKYEIIARIGRGGMGTVFRAKDITLDRDVAVKVLNPSLSDDELSLNRFLREAKLVSKLKHPNAISLYEFGVEGSVPYLVMEYVEGVSLEQLITTEGALDVVRTNNILQQVCSALMSAHEIGILHRDLKPDNIMVATRSDGVEFIQVLDFGMAKVLGAESEKGVKVSSTGVPCGTPHYMSPELITAQDVDLRADIYALGIIAYQMLVGQTPFEEFSTVEILYHQFHTVPPTITQANPLAKVSRGIEKAVAKALEKHPDDRFQSVIDFAEQFDQHVAEDFIFVNSSQATRVSPYRHRSSRLRKFRGLNNPLFKFWLAWFVIAILVVTSVWSLAKFSYVVRYYSNLGLIYVEDGLGHELKGFRKISSLDYYATPKEVMESTNTAGATDRVRIYVDSGRNLDIRDENGNGLLHIAVTARHARAIPVLLAGGINPSTRNNDGITPLMQAATRGSTGFVYALLEAGASVDATDDNGKTALMFAAQKGHLSTMHALLFQGAAINLGDDSGKSALMYGMDSQDPDVINFLLDQGASIEQRDSLGRPALYWAVTNGNEAIVDVLITRGAVIDVVSKGYVTPLMAAISKANYPVARRLVAAGASAEKSNSLGMTIKEMVRLQGPEVYRQVFGDSKKK